MDFPGGLPRGGELHGPHWKSMNLSRGVKKGWEGGGSHYKLKMHDMLINKENRRDYRIYLICK